MVLLGSRSYRVDPGALERSRAGGPTEFVHPVSRHAQPTPLDVSVVISLEAKSLNHRRIPRRTASVTPPERHSDVGRLDISHLDISHKPIMYHASSVIQHVRERAQELHRSTVVSINCWVQGVDVGVLPVPDNHLIIGKRYAVHPMPMLGQTVIGIQPTALMPKPSGNVEHPGLISSGEGKHIERMTLLLVHHSDRVIDHGVTADRHLNRMSPHPVDSGLLRKHHHDTT